MPFPKRFARTVALLSGAVALLCAPRALAAQRGASEFTRQIVLVAPFRTSGADPKLGRRAAERLRTFLQRRVDRREAYVFGDDSSEVILERAGFQPGDPVPDEDVVIVARRLRADEVVVGSATAVPGGVELRAELLLVRDPRRRQPLPPVRGADAHAAADSLSTLLLRARVQHPRLRRCENLSRDGRPRDAAREAEAGIREYPASTLLPLCLAELMIGTSGAHDSALTLAERVLARDSASIIAAVVRAQALELAGRAEDAASGWARVLALRGDSLELAVIGVERLLQLRRPLLAAEAVPRLLEQHPGDAWLRRQLFRAQHELARWEPAAALGDSLEATDAEFRADSNFAVRHVEALRWVGDTLAAVSKSARAARQHPGDARLYLQYVQLVGAEQGVALARGLARFPHEAPFRLLAAQSARASGDRAVERASLAAAVAADPTLAQGHLRIAELWFLDGVVDSAVAAVVRAPRAGAGAETVRAYALARGVQLLRAATDSAPASYRAPVALIALADSIDSRDDSRGLLAAAGLQGARSELVVAARGGGCDGLRRAETGLTDVAAVLARGVGAGSAADELRQAQAALQAAVRESHRRSCDG